MKAAVAAAMIVLVSSVLVLVVPALLVGAVVLFVGSAVAKLRKALGAILPRADGRRNVRVIVRRNSGA